MKDDDLDKAIDDALRTPFRVILCVAAVTTVAAVLMTLYC